MIKLKKCAWCGTPFQVKASSQKYCSTYCARQVYLDANPHLRPIPPELSCPHNVNLVCERHRCSQCGWNPKVAKTRLAKILANLEGSNGTN